MVWSNTGIRRRFTVEKAHSLNFIVRVEDRYRRNILQAFDECWLTVRRQPAKNAVDDYDIVNGTPTAQGNGIRLKADQVEDAEYGPHFRFALTSAHTNLDPEKKYWYDITYIRDGYAVSVASGRFHVRFNPANVGAGVESETGDPVFQMTTSIEDDRILNVVAHVPVPRAVIGGTPGPPGRPGAPGAPGAPGTPADMTVIEEAVAAVQETLTEVSIMRENYQEAAQKATDAEIAARDAWNAAVAAGVAATQTDTAAQELRATTVVQMTIEYALGESGTVAPETGWTTDPPERTEGTFLWMRTEVVHGDGTTVYSTPVPVSGLSDGSGTSGSDGVSVVSVTPFYQKRQTSLGPPDPPTTDPPDGWSDVEPGYSEDMSLYRVERVQFSNGQFSYTTVTKVAAWEIAQMALVSANGRNALIVSSQDANGATHPDTGAPLVAGDAWWKMSTTDDEFTISSRVIAQWVWDGANWIPNLIGHQLLSSIDVNNLQVIGPAHMNEATLNKIFSDAGFFNVLAANRLVIGDTTNLWRDPESKRTYPGWTSNGRSLTRNGAGARSGAITTTSLLEVIPGEKLIGGFTDTRSGSTNTGTVSLVMERRVQSTQAWTTWGTLRSSTTGGVLNNLTAFEIPANTDAVRFGLFVEANMPTTTTTTLTHIWVRKQSGAVEIAEGAVRAEHLTIGAVPLDRLAPDVSDYMSSEIEGAAQMSREQIGGLEASLESYKNEVVSTYQTQEMAEEVRRGISKEFEDADKEILSSASQLVDTFRDEVNERNAVYDMFIDLNPATGITLGRRESPFLVNITDTELSFWEGTNKVAFISNERLMITSAAVGIDLAIGNFSFVPRESGNLSFKKV